MANWINPTRIEGKMNPAWYQEYYEANKAKIRNQQKERYEKQPYHGLNNLDYRKMVVSLLRERDGNECSICEELLDGETQIDHIIPRCVGGLDEASNLRLVHRSCNVHRERTTYVF